MDGLGDLIDKVTEKTGIKKIVEKSIKDCGCKKRREELNRLFPFKKEKK